MPKAISSRSAANASGCLVLFFGLFAAIGLLVFSLNFLVPCLQTIRAKGWTPTPCVIKSSAVASRGSGKDLRYYPDVLYSYTVAGQNYDGYRYSFFKLDFQNTYDPQSLLNTYPTSATATCYVNPARADEAVLDRNFQPHALSQLMSLVFVLVGLGGMFWVLKARRRAARNEGMGRRSWRPKVAEGFLTPTALSTPAASAATPFNEIPVDGVAKPPWQPTSSTPAGSSAGVVLLKPTMTPAGQSCIILGITLFWNGIVSVFVYQAIFGMKGADFMRIFMGLFMIPFVIIGIILILATLSAFGAMFVPRPKLKAQSANVPLGSTVEVSWQTSRGLVNPRQLTIKLEAREEATYTRGTDTYTDKNIFLSQAIFESTLGGGLDGRASFTLPADSMHSFEAPRNKIIWALKVKGDVPLWPNFEDEYRLVILPAPRAEYSPSGNITQQLPA